jgi:polyisoprenoid-binding protein YceI
VFRKLFASGLLTVLMTTLVVNGAQLKVDSAHSNIGFSVPILGGLSTVRGKFSEFAVEINYDEADTTKSSVTAVIKAASIDTGIAARDEHLRTADFFEVEKYPEITFRSKQVEKKGKQLLAHGTFSMHGVSKEIILPITMTGRVVNPETKRTTYGFTATLKVDRRDYGINYQRKGSDNFIGNEITVELVLLAGTPAPQ